jgi:uncharacterized protein YfiM (DUF2279 family)
VITLALVATLTAAPGSEPGADRWFAEDKWRHYVTSFVATSLSASLARAAGLDRSAAIRAGAAASLAAGLGKEIHDARSPTGRFSVRDLVWDAAGVASSAAVLSTAR